MHIRGYPILSFPILFCLLLSKPRWHLYVATGFLIIRIQSDMPSPALFPRLKNEKIRKKKVADAPPKRHRYAQKTKVTSRR